VAVAIESTLVVRLPLGRGRVQVRLVSGVLAAFGLAGIMRLAGYAAPARMLAAIGAAGAVVVLCLLPQRQRRRRREDLAPAMRRPRSGDWAMPSALPVGPVAPVAPAPRPRSNPRAPDRVPDARARVGDLVPDRVVHRLLERLHAALQLVGAALYVPGPAGRLVLHARIGTAPWPAELRPLDSLRRVIDACLVSGAPQPFERSPGAPGGALAVPLWITSHTCAALILLPQPGAWPGDRAFALVRALSVELAVALRAGPRGDANASRPRNAPR
jgi:hypothetical protein